MEEYLTLILNQLEIAGFFETRASLGMDIIISFLVILPILSGISIFFAIRQKLKLHQLTQFLLFFLTLIVLGLFAYIIYYNKGFESLLQKSSIDTGTGFMVLVGHAIISFSTLVLWFFALLYALSDRKRRALPGLYSQSHANAGKRVFKGILLTSFSTMGIYWMLFMA